MPITIQKNSIAFKSFISVQTRFIAPFLSDLYRTSKQWFSDFLFPSYTLQVSKTCNLRCAFCPLWKKYGDEEHTLPKLNDLIQKNSFFKVFPRRKTYNLIGGEPFLNTDLAYILAFLKSEYIKTRVWTNALLPFDAYEKALPYIDETVIYLPSSDSNEFNLITGENGLDKVMETVDFLMDNKKKVALHFPVRLDSIGYLPLVYELAYKKKLPLVIHYSEKENLNSETLSYIHRFFHVQNVTVYISNEVTKKSSILCHALPYPGLDEGWQMYRNLFYETVNRIRRRFGL